MVFYCALGCMAGQVSYEMDYIHSNTILAEESFPIHGLPSAHRISYQEEVEKGKIVNEKAYTKQI